MLHQACESREFNPHDAPLTVASRCAATAPLSEEGGYINFMAEDDQDRIRVNYKDNYDRLVEIKRKYDPDNTFRVNQNIRP